VPLVFLERSWWAGFNGIYLVRFGFRMWEILILKWFLPLKIQINSKTPVFGKEKSVEDVVTLGLTARAHTSEYNRRLIKDFILHIWFIARFGKIFLGMITVFSTPSYGWLPLRLVKKFPKKPLRPQQKLQLLLKSVQITCLLILRLLKPQIL
jgi:hypothetical protein